MQIQYSNVKNMQKWNMKHYQSYLGLVCMTLKFFVSVFTELKKLTLIKITRTLQNEQSSSEKISPLDYYQLQICVYVRMKILGSDCKRACKYLKTHNGRVSRLARNVTLLNNNIIMHGNKINVQNMEIPRDKSLLLLTWRYLDRRRIYNTRNKNSQHTCAVS